MNLRNRLFFSLCLFTIAFIIYYYKISLVNWPQQKVFFGNFVYYPISNRTQNQNVTSVEAKPSYRGCIATLIRSDSHLGLNKLLNMLNSLSLFFKNINYYTIYLFHESNLINSTKQQIFYCTMKLNIKFYEIEFNYSIPSNRSGYASMCQFWSYDIWFKYDVLRSQCDYVMRFDDDSYLINYTESDLFETFHTKQLDYGYRIVYHDNNGLDFFQENLRQFLPQNRTRRGCIEGLCTHLNGHFGYDGLAVYNNFFLMRLNLIYEHPIIEEYLKQLVSTHAFYKYAIGDANVQTICLLLVEKPLKISFLKFPYNHNVHGSASSQPSFIFHQSSALMWHFQLRVPNATCKKLIISTRHNIITKEL